MRDLKDTHLIATGILQSLKADVIRVSEYYDKQSVEGVVRAVFSTLHGDLTGNETSLLAEVEELGRTIADAKADIAALRVGDITDSDIPSATDELDAIVAHTATATNCILEACETLDAVSAGMAGAAVEKMIGATSKIYEACSFQDITGQRISKVVATLKCIEIKIAHIVSTFSVEILSENDDLQSGPLEGASLLNGPQLPMMAMDQLEIDRLLASFE
jgi:chemotaxis protein CheZ